MAKGLTDRQQEVFNFIVGYIEDRGYPPTIREMQEGLGIGSLRGVTIHLDALHKKGFIERFSGKGGPPRQARGIRGRRREADEVQPRLQGGDAELVVLLGRKVDHDQPIDACLPGVGQEPVDAVDIDRVVISHEDDGGRVVAGAELADHGEGLGQAVSPLQGPQRRRLDDRAVGHRIGERHAEFDDVGTGPRQSLQQRGRGRVVGVTRRDEGNETGPALRRKGLETGCHARRHGRAPSRPRR